MIFHGAFARRRFEITAEGRSGRGEIAGNVIIGLPQGQYPEFEREHTLEDRQRILRQILTPKDLWELNQQLGRTMRCERRWKNPKNSPVWESDKIGLVLGLRRINFF